MEQAHPESWIKLEPDVQGWARITMAREPVNSMNLPFWQRLSELLHTCEQAPDIRGVIFCSGLKRPVFTAGNDINELYAPGTSRQRHRRFWKVSNEFMCSLYESPLLTVAAINGATVIRELYKMRQCRCPAGGCCISLCCDYRVMADGARIGLNEVELGIAVPKFWASLMARTVSSGVAEKLCAFAQMADAQQALSIGMVDEVVPASQVVQAAETAMAAMLRLPDDGRIITKRQARSEFAAAWRAYLPAEAELAFSKLQTPETTAALKAVLQRLSSKRSRL